MRIKFIVLLPFAVALFSVSLSSCNNLSNIFEYDVVAEPITKEVFEEAYSHRLEYNLVRDTSSLDWFTKKKIEVAIFRTLDDDEKESYVWEESKMPQQIRNRKAQKIMRICRRRV